jgi:hypothetical protein
MFVVVAFAFAMPSLKQTFLVLVPFLYRVYFPPLRKLSRQTSNPELFSGLWPSFLKLSHENNLDIGAILLLCLFFELQGPPSLEHEPRTAFWGYILCFCNLFFEQTTLVLAPFSFNV